MPGKEMVDIYNDRMEKIGKKKRDEVHRDGNWHKAFHCWVISRDLQGEEYIVFQRRSPQKESVPNSLDITAAGHLETGESPEEGLREVREELGIEIEKSRLVQLGIHVEVYNTESWINREFDHVFLLDSNLDLNQYRVQADEVVALTKIKIADGIRLFSGKAESIPAQTVVFDDKGMPMEPSHIHLVTISEFAGGKRNNYYIKVLLLAQKYFAGEKLLYV